ncbi:MAG TPA: diaminopimelate decarboxylase [Candidatus Aminicenantes bacterium]|nr:diaminopimelate decarboxylase [Candidatus Aminicenantes bacterium]
MFWWENEFLQVKAGRLFPAGRDAAAIAGGHGTPLFIYGSERIRANFRRLASGAGPSPGREIRICYALKANAHPGILSLLKNEGAWIDAVSPGEVQAAVRAGFPPGRILFTGTSCGTSDFEPLLRRPGLTINLDALEQFPLLKAARDRIAPGRRVRISVRWNPGLGRGFNPKVITAGARSANGTPVKFGIEPKDVPGLFRRARAAGFDPVGIHQHLGSGWVRDDYPAVLEAVDRIVGLARRLEDEGFPLEFVDFGGGFGARYARSQKPFPVERYLRTLLRRLDEAGIKAPALAVEPGKYLVADAGLVLLRVEYLKRGFGNLFACVNAGTFNTVPRPAIYDTARHEIINATRVDEKPKRKMTIAGHLCETGDVFGIDVRLPEPRPGDLLAVLNAGAYARSMASTFNQRPIPEEILV